MVRKEHDKDPDVPATFHPSTIDAWRKKTNPNPAKPQKPLIVHSELHPKRETLEDCQVERRAWMETGEAELGSCKLEM